ncbi:MAG TPA: DUF6538 domain-containing protein, partial [Stellaceae bacterium]|nr:DUF6538 domain-containing protein [Stellaceae bacterium]
MISYLQKRRGRYFIRVRVPHELRALYSGQFVERHLGTGDYDEAKRKAPDALAPIFDDFAARRAGVAAVAPALDHIFATARARAYAAIIAGKPIPFIDGRTALEGRDVPAAGSIDVADVAIAEALQEAERMATYNLPAPSPVAPWRASVKPGEPVQSLADLESYLASFEGLAKPLYIAKRRGSIKAILATMPNLADVTRPAVQAWHDANRTMAPESLKRHRNDARGFFKWLRAHGKLAGLPSES